MKQFFVICKDAEDSAHTLQQFITQKKSYILGVTNSGILKVDLSGESYFFISPNDRWFLGGIIVNGWKLSSKAGYSLDEAIRLLLAELKCSYKWC
ncbi:hypothetical protein ACRW9N_13510 [Listeria aquatica]|uniref:hypothetical protein n=1 Tax=Listeria aquatica TaxID=1494960 RepID=UPI003EF914EC